MTWWLGDLVTWWVGELASEVFIGNGDEPTLVSWWVGEMGWRSPSNNILYIFCAIGIRKQFEPRTPQIGNQWLVNCDLWMLNLWIAFKYWIVICQLLVIVCFVITNCELWLVNHSQLLNLIMNLWFATLFVTCFDCWLETCELCFVITNCELWLENRN